MSIDAIQPVIIKGSVGDSLYLRFSDAQISTSVEFHPDIILDVDVTGTVVGIGFQHVSELIKEHYPISSMDGSHLRMVGEGACSQNYHLLEPVQNGRLVYQKA